MKNILTVSLVAALGFCIWAPSATAQEVATAKTRARMIRAFCTTGPCNPGTNFDSGSALVNRMRQPKPLTKRKIGRIRLHGVRSTPLPSALSAVLTSRLVWDTIDPDGDCPVLGADTSETLATGSLFCTQQGGHATCGGDLLVPLGLLDPRCTDVRLTLHDMKFEVYQFNMVGNDAARIAVDGVSIVPQDIDCSSGGSGCP